MCRNQKSKAKSNFTVSLVALTLVLSSQIFAQESTEKKLVLEPIPAWRSFPDCSDGVNTDLISCRITKNLSLAEVKAHLGSENYRIWTKGNTWNVAYKTKEKSEVKVQMQGGIQLPLSNFRDTNIWLLSLNIPGLDRSVISAAITYQSEGSFITDTSTIRQWRGDNAEDKPVKNEDLTDKFKVDSLWSDTLNTWRKISVYIPSKPAKEEKYPVIYFADGQGMKEYAEIIDPLIENGELPPVVLIGIWGRTGLIDSEAPPFPSNSYRTVEYHEGVEESPGADSLFVLNHHKSHKYFFTHEVPEIAEQKYSVSSDPDFKAIHGVSSGANFALMIGREMPDKYGFIIANSLGPATVKKEPELGWEHAARHYLSIGLLEQMRMQLNLSSLQDSLEKYKVPSMLDIYPSGHDSGVWRESLPKAVNWWLIADQTKF